MTTMIDVRYSDHHHHWEDLQKDPGSKNELDQSFHTVHSHADHPEDPSSNSTSVDLPKELFGEDKSVAGTVSTAKSRSGPPAVTTYEDVVYHEEVGTLLLNSQRITFQPHEDQSDQEEKSKNYNLNHQSWRWKAIRKHKVTPAKSGKIMLKLVSIGDAHKGVTFSFHSREELDRVRKDVSRRLKQAREEDHSNNNYTNNSTETPLKVKPENSRPADSPAATAATLDTAVEDVPNTPQAVVTGDTPKGKEFVYQDDNDGKLNTTCHECQGCIIL